MATPVEHAEPLPEGGGWWPSIKEYIEEIDDAIANLDIDVDLPGNVLTSDENVGGVLSGNILSPGLNTSAVDEFIAARVNDSTSDTAIALHALFAGDDGPSNPGTPGATIPRRFSILDYGATMDAIQLTNVVTVAGQPTVSSSSRSFTSADIGKTIAVMGAGPIVANANDGVWISTIVSVSGGTATLASNATSSGSGRRCIFGTPDDAAFAAAQNAAIATNGIAFGLTGGTVYIPPGRTIVTLPLVVKNYVSWKGEHREQSWVHVVQDSAGTASASGFSDWLSCAGRDEDTPLIGAEFSDFGIEAEAHIHTAGYGASIKPLNIYYVKRCSIRRMNVWHTPVTAIPFDHSYEQCTIEQNFILEPGRLAPSGIGPGGSGIGAGTKGVGATEPTLISNNVIIGTWSATVEGPGHNGIFTEAQGGADSTAGTNGYRIVDNLVIGMYYGISDTGSNGTIIQGNTIIGCSRGIAVRKTTLSGSYPGLSTSIIGNVVRSGRGPMGSDGIGILVSIPSSGPAVARDLHTIVHSNQVIDNQSWGIYVNIQTGATVDMAGVSIHGNEIARNGRSGIRLSCESTRKLHFVSVTHNQIANNGRALVTGDQWGILVSSGTVMSGGRIQDNDLWDFQSSRTQLGNVGTAGATLTGVTVSGNTSEPVSDTSAPSVPGTPTATGGAGQVTLTWSAAADNTAVTGYHVYRSDAPTVSIATAGTNNYVDTTAIAGTSYTYTIDAFDAAGNTSAKSPSSNSATPSAALPGAPTSVTGTAGNGLVGLNWTAPASNGGSAITDYAVQYSSNGGGSWTSFTHTASTATNITVTGLTNGTAYTFRVAAVNSTGTGSYSSASAAITPTSVAAFVNDTFTDTAGTSLGAHVGELGATWSKNTASTLGAMSIAAGGTTYSGTTNATSYHPSGVPASADYTVEADLVFVSSLASQTLGIGLRASTSTTDRYLLRYSVGQGNWALVKTAGTSATLGSTLAATLTPGSTHHMVITASGSTISATVDGTLVASVTDTALTAAGSPVIVASTTASTATTGMHIDNFNAHS